MIIIEEIKGLIFGSVRYIGSARVGSGRVGSVYRVGSARLGSVYRAGSARLGAGRLGSARYIGSCLESGSLPLIFHGSLHLVFRRQSR